MKPHIIHVLKVGENWTSYCGETVDYPYTVGSYWYLTIRNARRDLDPHMKHTRVIRFCKKCAEHPELAMLALANLLDKK